MTISLHACLPKKKNKNPESLTINLSHSRRSVCVFPKVTGCLLNVRRDKSALRKRDSLFRFGSQLEKRGTHELIHDLAARTGEAKVSVGARWVFFSQTYRPSGGAGADPDAPTDATILTGAARLALPRTRPLTAGGKMEAKFNESTLEQKTLHVSWDIPAA